VKATTVRTADSAKVAVVAVFQSTFVAFDAQLMFLCGFYKKLCLILGAPGILNLSMV
jgi:hypothetical protein